MYRFIVILVIISSAFSAPQKFGKNYNYARLSNPHVRIQPPKVEFEDSVEDIEETYKSEAVPVPAVTQRILTPIAPVVPAVQNPGYDEYQKYLEYQNANAMYKFESDVEDHISDLNQKRSEVRNGKNVEGMYSYSDGYVMRTVHYVADDKGYRIVKEDVVPLAEDGPNVDLNGRASVRNALHGTHVAYTVQSVPAEGPVPKIIDGQSQIVEVLP